MIEAFQAAGVSVEDAIRVGALVIVNKWDTYLRMGPFDPQAMLQYLQDQVAAATAAGFVALRVTGEVNWIQTTQDVTRFLEYEARLNDIIPQSGLLGMCQYHRDCVRPEMVLGILDTHPRIVEKKGLTRPVQLVTTEERRVSIEHQQRGRDRCRVRLPTGAP